MSLAPFVQIVARGKGRARSMTLCEARDAMGLMLRDDTPMEAIGALLMVLRLRGETDEEIAGFTAGLRRHVHGVVPEADLDWPVYAAGRSRGAPLFLLSARLVAQAGYRVSMHGHSPDPQIAANLELAGPGVRYDALDTLAPRAFSLLRLRDTLGLRSCINTVLRMWTPSRAPASVQGVFHPSYRGLQARAAELLGQRDLMVIKGGGGEFERHPGKEIALFGLRNGAHMQATAPALISEAVRLQDGGADVDLAALWYGQRGHAFAEAVIVGTAALALWTVKAAPSLEAAEALARSLWEARHHAEGLLA